MTAIQEGGGPGIGRRPPWEPVSPGRRGDDEYAPAGDELEPAEEDEYEDDAGR